MVTGLEEMAVSFPFLPNVFLSFSIFSGVIFKPKIVNSYLLIFIASCEQMLIKYKTMQ